MPDVPAPDLAPWRKLVDKELDGAAFDDKLRRTVLPGVTLEPLYAGPSVARPLPGIAPFVRGARPLGHSLVCARIADGGDVAELAREALTGGAQALWLPAGTAALAAIDALGLRGLTVVLSGGADARVLRETIAAQIVGRLADVAPPRFLFGGDPLGALADGGAAAVPDPARALAALGALAAECASSADVRDGEDGTDVAALVSSLPYHAAGADAALELGALLSSATAVLRATLDAGISPSSAARQIGLQVSVGRDTYLELAKLRALRWCWHKVLAAHGAPHAPPALLHAVGSPRTLTARDPWVNMLRATTQTFAALAGGAELVTPCVFDARLTAPSALGRRVARNTALVLTQESFLGQVIDPAGGSPFFETATHELARAAWRDLQAIEAGGGVATLLESGALEALIGERWAARPKAPVLGVSVHAVAGETLPSPPAARAARAPGALPVRFDDDDLSPPTQTQGGAK